MVSLEENKWMGVRRKTAHLFSSLEPWLSGLSKWAIGRSVSAPFPSGKSESETETDSEAVCFLARGPSDSYYKAKHNTLTSLCNQTVALILSVSHMQLFSNVFVNEYECDEQNIHVTRYGLQVPERWESSECTLSPLSCAKQPVSQFSGVLWPLITLISCWV